MLIRTKRRWEMPESAATPEQFFFDRRALLAGTGGFLAAATLPFAAAAEDDPTASLYPAKRNEAYKLDRDLTPEKVSGVYNNFYEYGTSKDIASAAQQLKTRPWTVKIDGLVGKPKEWAIDDLIKAVSLEERLYRHRCVEAWSMAVPWTGFPLKSLLALAEPQGGAKYVRFETFNDKKMAPGQKLLHVSRGPTSKGVTMAEATQRPRVPRDRRLRQAAAKAVRRAAASRDCRGNTASSPMKSITCGSAFVAETAEHVSGKRCSPANMASGRT